MLEALKDSYPHQLRCPGRAVGGTAILTSLTPVPGTEVCAPGLTAMQLIAGDERFWAVSIHMHWPWPYSQAEHVEMLVPILTQLKGPAIMAGDFNMVRWAYSVKRMAASLDVRPGGPTIGSFQGLSAVLPLAIDHVFSTRSGRVTLRGLHGSDHYGLLAEMEI
jgi:endonuclease/exonuclease/phosphatase (EEP) superfamily protein YafD